jgi:hypothetical protein
MNLSVASVHDINVAVNSVYRKIFLYNKWKSVKPLMYFCGKVDARHIIDKKSIAQSIKALRPFPHPKTMSGTNYF